MTMLEHAIASIKSMKGKTAKEKWVYFLDYFAIPTAAIIIVLASIISWRISVASSKNVVLAGILVNSTFSEESPDFNQNFYHYAGINDNNEEALFTTSIGFADDMPQFYSANLQMIYAQVGVGDVDFITGPEQIFPLFAYNRSHMLVDLRKVLPEEILMQLEGRLYYVDNSIVEQPEDYSDLSAAYDPDESYTMEYPDPTKPDQMVDPIPIGIDIRDCLKFLDTYYPGSNTLYLGIAANHPHPEMLLTFLDYLLSENG